MATKKLYPITQVVIDIYGQDAQVLEQINTLSNLAKPPSKRQKDPTWATIGDQDPITTLLFTKVLTGHLPAIDSTGHKIDKPTRLNQFTDLYATEDEVNSVLCEAGYRFIWTPKIRKTKPKSVAMNWKQEYQAEATAYYIRTWGHGATPNRKNCADTLAKWGALNKKTTDLGKIPGAGYIRVHVIGTQHWTPPKKPTS